MTEYKRKTDVVHVIKLPSKITHALWCTQTASPDETVNLKVLTQFVGNKSDISITIMDKSGGVMEEIKGELKDNYFSSSITVPDHAQDELVFTVTLPEHNLTKDSDALLLLSPRSISNAKWGQEVARRGDIVKLTAETEGFSNGTDVEIIIYEYDQDGRHDFITKFPATVTENKIEAFWEYEYHEDTDEIPSAGESEKGYNPPEYFFTVKVGNMEFLTKQESGLLEFKDWIEIGLRDETTNEPMGNEEYVVILPDGQQIKGNLDNKGFAQIKDIPPGRIKVIFPNI